LPARELDFTVQSLTRGWRDELSRRAMYGGTALLQSDRLLTSASWAAVSGVRAGLARVRSAAAHVPAGPGMAVGSRD